MNQQTMNQQLKNRLQQLKAEFESGQKFLTELESKQSNVRNTMLRISGAIQVIEEELTKANDHQDQDQDQAQLIMLQTNGHAEVTTPFTIEVV